MLFFSIAVAVAIYIIYTNTMFSLVKFFCCFFSSLHFFLLVFITFQWTDSVQLIYCSSLKVVVFCCELKNFALSVTYTLSQTYTNTQIHEWFTFLVLISVVWFTYATLPNRKKFAQAESSQQTKLKNQN